MGACNVNVFKSYTCCATAAEHSTADQPSSDLVVPPLWGSKKGCDECDKRPPATHAQDRALCQETSNSITLPSTIAAYLHHCDTPFWSPMKYQDSKVLMTTNPFGGRGHMSYMHHWTGFGASKREGFQIWILQHCWAPSMMNVWQSLHLVFPTVFLIYLLTVFLAYLMF